ncbi:hypothetical protein KI387_021209 [Taxus chinensis]|uniref:Germin-like protein n=1 Tax=Taxus chinensis TaxID=29808 RepID=A0AA38GDD2_TAXCH|nr:hypothetical protein KI387_021209 [Taxus chinensis]
MVAMGRASDPDPLQDFCVADLSAGTTKVNGFACKDPNTVKASDFFFKGLKKPGLTNNTFNINVTSGDVESFPGINTLRISMFRVDFARGGLNPPHSHPRVTEIVYLMKGAIIASFVTTNNVLYSQKLVKGEPLYNSVDNKPLNREFDKPKMTKLVKGTTGNPQRLASCDDGTGRDERAAKVNGFACKDPNTVKASDFLFKGLNKPGLTNNTFNINVTSGYVESFPGINTLGISMFRVDFAQEGLNPPHSHPRAREIVYLMKGTLIASFVTTKNVLHSQKLVKGDVFVIRRGLVHFQ